LNFLRRKYYGIILSPLYNSSHQSTTMNPVTQQERQVLMANRCFAAFEGLQKGKNHFNNKNFSGKYLDYLSKRKSLPVYKCRLEILVAYFQNQILIIKAGIGAGKSTEIPALIEFAEWWRNQEDISVVTKGRIVCCTQPRVVATMKVAERVAAQSDVQLGEYIGYRTGQG
jgi:HrpA-like RNA helicase